MKINKLIFTLVILATLNASGMQDERKWSMKPTFFNAQQLVNNAFMRVLHFQLLDKDPKRQNHPRDGEIASSLVSCEDNSCEMVSLLVNRKGSRGQGYGSLLLQNVLSYLTINTNVTEMGLLAKPMAVVDRPYAGNFYKQLFHFQKYTHFNEEREQSRLQNFYKKNGGENAIEECVKDGRPESFCSKIFTFNLRKNK